MVLRVSMPLLLLLALFFFTLANFLFFFFVVRLLLLLALPPLPLISGRRLLRSRKPFIFPLLRFQFLNSSRSRLLRDSVPFVLLFSPVYVKIEKIQSEKEDSFYLLYCCYHLATEWTQAIKDLDFVPQEGYVSFEDAYYTVIQLSAMRDLVLHRASKIIYTNMVGSMCTLFNVLQL